MKLIIKTLCAVLALFISFSFAGCGSDNNNESNVSQTAYATIFQQPTSVKPITTTSVTTDKNLNQTTILNEATYTTVARTGKIKNIKQDKPMRNISSEQLLTQINVGINLGENVDGVGLGSEKGLQDYETYAGNPVVTKDLISAYSKAGFKAVRVPISWSDHMDSSGNINSLWLDRIQEIVDYVYNDNLYCIINSQNDQSWLNTNNSTFNATKEKFKKMWLQIAERFKNYNDKLIFEGFGELLKSDNDRSEPSNVDIKNTNILNNLFVSTVRSTGGNNSKRHLIVGTYGSGVSQEVLNGFTLPKDTAKNKLIAKVNFYLPSAFCLKEHESASWGTDSDKKYICDIFHNVYEKFNKLNLPVIIGEFGAVAKGNDTARVNYVKHVISTAYNYYFVCFWWDDGSKFKLISRTDFNVTNSKILESLITNSD